MLGKGLANMMELSFLITDRTWHGDLLTSMERVAAVLVHCNLAQHKKRSWAAENPEQPKLFLCDI